MKPLITNEEAEKAAADSAKAMFARNVSSRSFQFKISTDSYRKGIEYANAKYESEVLPVLERCKPLIHNYIFGLEMKYNYGDNSDNDLAFLNMEMTESKSVLQKLNNLLNENKL